VERALHHWFGKLSRWRPAAAKALGWRSAPLSMAAALAEVYRDWLLTSGTGGISRPRLVGHRIPAWFDGFVVNRRVIATPLLCGWPRRRPKPAQRPRRSRCGQRGGGRRSHLEAGPDVLNRFSSGSALSTWLADEGVSADLATWYPPACLVTASTSFFFLGGRGAMAGRGWRHSSDEKNRREKRGCPSRLL